MNFNHGKDAGRLFDLFFGKNVFVLIFTCTCTQFQDIGNTSKFMFI